MPPCKLFLSVYSVAGDKSWSTARHTSGLPWEGQTPYLNRVAHREVAAREITPERIRRLHTLISKLKKIYWEISLLLFKKLSSWSFSSHVWMLV